MRVAVIMINDAPTRVVALDSLCHSPECEDVALEQLQRECQQQRIAEFKARWPECASSEFAPSFEIGHVHVHAFDLEHEREPVVGDPIETYYK